MNVRRPSKTIAVLPFMNMSSSKENEYFSDGMTEEIINALAKIKELKVTSRTSSFHFKDKHIPIPQIGQELNVSTILEGSVRLAGKMMRITAQLIDVEDDYHFWSETFDRSMDNLFEVQDEISLLIADKLREHVGHLDIDDHLVETPDIPVEIYQKYLEARYHLLKLDLPSIEKGIAILKEIIARQPNFPLPYLGINQGYAYLGTMGQLPAAEAFAAARPYLEKAIELGENLPEVQLNMAWIAWWEKWDFEAGYRHILKAIDLRPSDAIYLTMANFLSVEGKYKAAHTYMDKAIQLDPFNPMNHHMKGFLFYLEEDYETAIIHFDKSLGLKPDLYFPRVYRGQALLLMGKVEESLAYCETFPVDVPGDLSRLGGMTLAYAALGKKDLAMAGIAELNAALQTDAMGSAMSFLVLCLNALEKEDEALEIIEKGISYRLPAFMLMQTEPLVKSLHSNSRFQILMSQMFGKKAAYKAPKRKYKQSLFTPEILAKHKAQLDKMMEEEKPFLEPDLSLRGLAEKMSLPPNHLSQLLNEGFDKNFAEFVNTYRLEDFKERVADPSQRNLTILALAYESGFNSKTVFNTFFRKVMGKTPRAYWKEVVG